MNNAGGNSWWKTWDLRPRELRLVMAIAILTMTTGQLRAQAKTEQEVVEHARFQAAQKILTEHCTKCHGVDKQESGLRLDSQKALLKGGDFGPAVVLQKALESELIHRVSSKNDDEVMPPEGPRLTSNEVAQLVAWINAGVPWPGAEELDTKEEDPRMNHWAWQEINRPNVPAHVTAFSDADSIEPERNEIDYFLFDQNWPIKNSRHPRPLTSERSFVVCILTSWDCRRLRRTSTRSLPTCRPKATKSLSISFSHRRTMASAGHGIGWMSCTTATHMAMTRISLGTMLGLIETMSFEH